MLTGKKLLRNALVRAHRIGYAEDAEEELLRGEAAAEVLRAKAGWQPGETSGERRPTSPASGRWGKDMKSKY